MSFEDEWEIIPENVLIPYCLGLKGVLDMPQRMQNA
jgi:hypothetical protein